MNSKRFALERQLLSMGAELRKAELRFWFNVPHRRPGTCWEWQGAMSNTGYGQLSINSVILAAHRFSWIIHNGRAIPEGLVVRHKVCGNPACVNPDHLDIGTQQENHYDTWVHGRRPYGEKNARARLTDAMVRRIRNSNSSTLNLTELARELGIDRSYLYRVRTGQGWPHIPTSQQLPRHGRHHPDVKITEETVRKIRQDHSINLAAMARKLGVAKNTLSQARSGKRWRHLK